jgi:hypothetical protein
MRIVIPITLAEFSSQRLPFKGEITKEKILQVAKQSELSKQGVQYPPNSPSAAPIQTRYFLHYLSRRENRM